MKYVRSFLPWIAFATIAGRIDWRYTALLGLIMSLLVLAWGRRERKPTDALVLEISGTIFFALLAAFTCAFNKYGPALHSYITAMASGWLAVTAWLSIITRRPFTLGIAKSMVESEVWNSPRFVRVNMVMSSVWALSFTAETAALGIVLASAPDAVLAVIVIKILVWTVPMGFTFAYPAILRSRAARQMASAQPARMPIGQSWNMPAPQGGQLPPRPAGRRAATPPGQPQPRQSGYLASEEPTQSMASPNRPPLTGRDDATLDRATGIDRGWPSQR
jgi:hypothetical protein